MSDSKYSLVQNEYTPEPVSQQPSGYASMPQPTPPAYAVQQPGQMPGYNTLPQPTVLTNQPASTYLVSTTTVVTTQPRRKWRQNLCDCCKSCNVCMSVYCCRLWYSCAVAKKLGENGCIVCCPGGLAILRAKLRQTHNIEGTLMDDVCTSVWCSDCVLCQMGVEMNAEAYPKAYGC